jgi:opacity protein-like surface antigen
VNAELRIQARSFEDIYGEAASFGVEGAYGLGGGRELFGALRAIEAEEAQAQVGQAFVPALSASLPVFGRFGAFQALSLEGGVRQYFDLGGGFAPYIGGRVGLTQVDGIRATFTVPVPAGVGAEPNDIALNNVRFYDDSTAFTVGLDVGVSFELAPGFSVGLDTGLRYQSGLKDDDRDIGALGLASINNEGDRLSVPLTLRAAFRF